MKKTSQLITSLLLLIILLFFLLFSIFSCSKQQDSNSSNNEFLNEQKMKIVSAINNKDADSALKIISELSEQNQEEGEIKYLKAEAYALKANIDIYSLFPMLKIKLFEFAINEWNDIRKYSERERSGIGDVVGENISDEEINNLENKIKEIESFPVEKITYTITDASSYYHEYFINPYLTLVARCYINLRFTSPLFVENHYEWSYLNIPTKNKDECEQITKQLTKGDQSILGLAEIANQFKGVQARIKKLAIVAAKEKIEKTYNRRAKEKYIQFFWAIYDSLPIIKSAPILNSNEKEHVLQALSLLKNIKDKIAIEDRIGKDSRQHMTLLAGFIIIEAIKSSIDVNKINNPSDLICTFMPTNLIANYPTALIAARYLLEIAKETGLFNLKDELLDKAIPFLQNAPNELTPQQQKVFIHQVSKIKYDTGC
ncbi:MAG: hypothetical protein HQK49_03970 [Oligoflexia bacterium]|nr:hypothetical protein [Oligoflexia bacterium]